MPPSKNSHLKRDRTIVSIGLSYQELAELYRLLYECGITVQNQPYTSVILMTLRSLIKTTLHRQNLKRLTPEEAHTLLKKLNPKVKSLGAIENIFAGELIPDDSDSTEDAIKREIEERIQKRSEEGNNAIDILRGDDD